MVRKTQDNIFTLPVLLILFAVACGSAAAPETVVVEKEVVREVPVDREVVKEVLGIL